MSPFLDRLEDLATAAQEIDRDDDAYTVARRENEIQGEACEAVAELSKTGDISRAEKNQLADVLADELTQYTKTDLKTEFDEYFQREQSGAAFDTLIEQRVDLALDRLDALKEFVLRLGPLVDLNLQPSERAADLPQPFGVRPAGRRAVETIHAVIDALDVVTIVQPFPDVLPRKVRLGSDVRRGVRAVREHFVDLVVNFHT